jgi:hypothetical protein
VLKGFPALFDIACVKEASVADNLKFLGGSNQWNVSFTREAHNWEVDDFAYFFQALHSVKVRRGREDKMCWSPPKKICSRSSHSSTSWLALVVVIFLGKVFGTLRLLQGLPFVCGPHPLAISLPWTTLGSDML